MSQNRSNAVMATRVEPSDSRDDFPTMSWGTRAFCRHVLIPEGLPLGSCWEPTSNRGYMVRPLYEFFDTVYASDVWDYSTDYPHGMFYFDKDGRAHTDHGQQAVKDFLFPGSEPPHIAKNGVNWCIFNPPFRLAQEFVQRGMQIAKVGVAALVRTAFLESKDRYETLYRRTPPNIVAQYVERLPMVKGRIDRRASTATSYCWLVWLKLPVFERRQTKLVWIPPCRAQLERDSDYEVVA